MFEKRYLKVVIGKIRLERVKFKYYLNNGMIIPQKRY